MRPASRWSSLAGLCGLALAACAGEIAGSPDLHAELKRYYDRYAMEEGGLCESPQLGLVTGSSIESQSEDRLILNVSYVYIDPTVRPTYGAPGHVKPVETDPGAKAVNTTPGATGPSQCKGFGTRRFTVARRADGFEVLEMTGQQHRGLRIDKIDDSKVW